MTSPAPDPLALKGTVIKGTPDPAQSSATAQSGTDSNVTNTAPAEGATVTQKPKAKARKVGRDSHFTAARLSSKFIERIFEEFSEDPDTDRIASKLHIPRLTVIEAVSHHLIQQIREAWSQRKPVAREAGASTQPGRRTA